MGIAGAVIGKLVSGLAGNLLGGMMGMGKPQQGMGGGVNVTQTQNTGGQGTVPTIGGTKAGTANKNAKLALKSNKGVFDDGSESAGRGKLLGN